MAAVSVGAQALTVKFPGIHKFWTLKRRLDVPLNHVVDARMDPALAASSPGWRLLGAEFPGVAVAGRFISNGERAFWDLRDPNKAVVIELQGERYKRLVLEVDDPETVVEAIHRALTERSPDWNVLGLAASTVTRPRDLLPSCATRGNCDGKG